MLLGLSHCLCLYVMRTIIELPDTPKLQQVE